MRNNKNRFSQIQGILLEVVSTDPKTSTPWVSIVDVIQSRLTVKNWLEVRSVLQNTPSITRTDSIFVEEFYQS
tara:strand:+ start:314 stop:532 length:219 start_codon:yes stop_codon:yes gene_type:complete